MSELISISKNYNTKLEEINSKVKDLSLMHEKLKTDFEAVDMKSYISKLNEIRFSIDKKASILDVKKVYGIINDITEKINLLEQNNDKFEDSLKHSEEFNMIQLQMGSLESKFLFNQKTLKELQTRINENEQFQIVSPTQDQSFDEKKDKRLSEITEKISEKIYEVNGEFAQFKINFNKLEDKLNNKLEAQSLQNTLTTFEDRIYKELDKVITTLTRKFGNKQNSGNELKNIENQIKQLFELYHVQVSSRESEDSLFKKRATPYISHEIDLYSIGNRPPGFSDWNKLPAKDSIDRSKVYII